VISDTAPKGPAAIGNVGLSRPQALSQGGYDSALTWLEALLSPAVVVASLWTLAHFLDFGLSTPYLILGVLAFALTFPSKLRLHLSLPSLILDVMLNWVGVLAVLSVFALVIDYRQYFSRSVLWHWVWLVPVIEVVGHSLIRVASPVLLNLQGPRERTVVVGVNNQGLSLAEGIRSSPYSRQHFVGFVDCRSPGRPEPGSHIKVLGDLEQLAAIVREQHVQQIYLSLPMDAQPRILKALDELKDTTASIFFVPDMFFTDLIQGQGKTLYGMPVISVCDTPFRAGNGFLKRSSDVILSLLIILMISPILLGVALAVKFTSPGPIIFRQRRYGLDGEEIMVYKFRSMKVTEDGGTIRQAQKNDSRITPLGAILRKTSLDELPQFINVLQGRMSIVGPRPHAVAHNEMYRKLIKGYMVRHKVKPGITGWAQVNGFRGETDTLDKMQARIDYDLDYLRNWSLKLDILIILKTVRLVAKDQSAY